MSTSHHAFTAGQYGVRSQDYVASVVHAQGEDLDQMAEFVRARPGGRVLDLGCGGGHVTYRAAPHAAEVVACDLTPSMLEAVAATAAERGLSNVRVQQAAAEALPFPDASFDLVLCRFTAHHWQDLDAGLRQALRVLKPGGAALFVDTVAPASRVFDTHLQTIELLRDTSHVRSYSVAEFVAALSRAGFTLDGLTLRQLRLEFSSWIARTRTSPVHASAIRSLQGGAPDEVTRHFRIEADGSFEIQSAAFVVSARPD